MPFDGNEAEIDRRNRTIAQQAADILGEVHRKFLTGERRWIRWSLTDGRNGFCVTGAVEKEAELAACSAQSALDYLVRAIREAGDTLKRLWKPVIADFNDRRTFVDVLVTLSSARKLAEADASPTGRMPTARLLYGLIEYYDLPHCEPRTVLMNPDIGSALRYMRAKLGIRGDDARECIIKGARGHGQCVRSLMDVREIILSYGTLESVLMRALDHASGQRMRQPHRYSPIDPGCTGGRAPYLRRQPEAAPGERWGWDFWCGTPPTMCV